MLADVQRDRPVGTLARRSGMSIERVNIILHSSLLCQKLFSERQTDSDVGGDDDDEMERKSELT